MSPLATRGSPLERHSVWRIKVQSTNPQCASYALVTAAYNEAKLIEKTILAVISQSHPPARWVIVSDGSTDETDTIVSRYAARYPFIQLHRLTHDHARNFAAQADAINAGIEQLAKTTFDFIGNLDADITFADSYFEQLLHKFQEDPELGLGGGLIHEKCPDGMFRSRRDNSLTSVAHAVQVFRRACFQSIGGRYFPLPYGGPDTYAEVSARMGQWRVSSFQDLEALHHRPTGSAGGLLRSCFRQGKMDYSLGTLPLFEMMKVLRRVSVKPYLVGSAARLSGFLWCYCKRDPRAVSDEFMVYFREEQRTRIQNLFRGGLTVQRLSQQ